MPSATVEPLKRTAIRSPFLGWFPFGFDFWISYTKPEAVRCAAWAGNAYSAAAAAALLSTSLRVAQSAVVCDWGAAAWKAAAVEAKSTSDARMVTITDGALKIGSLWRVAITDWL